MLGWGLYTCGGVALVLLVLVVAVHHRDQVGRHWTTGLALSALVTLLVAPSQVVTVMYLDVVTVLGEVDVPEPMLDDARATMGWAVAFGVALSAVVGLVGRTLLVPVAIAAEPERPPFPLITGHSGAFGGWWLALPASAALGVASAALFWVLGVGESDVLKQQQAWLLGVDVDSSGYVLGVGVPFALGAAVSEELWFRGVLQRWLAPRVGGVLAVLATTALWTLGHAGSADHVALELGQVGLLGLVLGGLERRYSVEACIVAHAGFNASVVLVGFALGA